MHENGINLHHICELFFHLAHSHPLTFFSDCCTLIIASSRSPFLVHSFNQPQCGYRNSHIVAGDQTGMKHQILR